MPLLLHIEKVIGRKLVFLLLFFLVSQTLSVINAVNINSFLLVYKNIIESLLIFCAGVAILNSDRRKVIFVRIVVATIVINLIYQLLLFVVPTFFMQQFQLIMYEKYWEVLALNADRGRFFVDNYDPALIPFVLYLLYKVEGKFYKLTFVFVALMELLVAILSGFRTHFLVYIIAFFGGVVSISSQKKLFFGAILSLVIFSGVIFKTQNIDYRNSLDRLIMPASEDYSSINSRIEFWRQSLEMGLSSPWFGVGLGNYFDNFQNKELLKLSYFDWKNEFELVTINHPHNIFFSTFAETGLVGLVAFSLLHLYFAASDYSYFKKRGALFRTGVISFWGLFMFSLLIPANTIQFLSIYWAIRAILVNNKIRIQKK
ncbi:MAG: O-antigen ligase family protein [Candidatus Levybacteria bacterium]|nr:O-antigen ligase family protein [Candidatus Levybacteria bacterium]